jgi:hypothetical protein
VKVPVGAKRPSFEPYAIRVNSEFKALLSSGADERQIQVFLEHHPALVPGALTPSSSSGHDPLHCALVTQPLLPGFHSRMPDFMWIAAHSGRWYPTLIEIENPSKRLFTSGSRPTAKFTEARTQLAQWRSWFQNPTNVQQFMELYGVPETWRRDRGWQLHMILIYGRRAEFDGSPELSRLRDSLMPSTDEDLMSFDRLTVDPKLEAIISVRARGDGRFEVVWVPETFGTSSSIAKSLVRFDRLAEAIDRNDRISGARRAFLKTRIEHWQAWGAARGRKTFQLSLE